MQCILCYLLIFIINFHENHALYNISYDAGGQTITVAEGHPLLLHIHHIGPDHALTNCSGECSTKEEILKADCTVLQMDRAQYLNVIINKPMKKSLGGPWNCHFPVKRKNLSKNIELTFNVKIEKSLPPERETIPLTNKKVVKFEITSPDEVFNQSLGEGDQTVVMNISKIKEKFEVGTCSGWCEITQLNNNISISACSTYLANGTTDLFVTAELTMKVTTSFYGAWKCTINLPHSHKKVKQILNMVITVPPEPIEPWIYIVIAISVCVILIIIGQTVCILYFKAKAKRAKINKNLTPKNSTHSRDVPDTRYVKQTSGAGEMMRESGIYEALEPIRDRAPIPPPIETLPVTPNVLRSASQNNLHMRNEPQHFRTTPRTPRQMPSPGKFNTVDRCSSEERTKNRPQHPLPQADIVYEDVTVMTPGPSPEAAKAWNRFQPKTLEKSPLLTPPKPKKALFGQKPPVEPPQERARYGAPPGLKPHVGIPSNVPSPGLGRRPMAPPGNPVPGPSGRAPIGQGQPMPGLPPGVVTAMGGVQILPSMISPAMLRPVNKNMPKAPIEPSRMTAEPTRMPPPTHSNSNMSKLKPVPPSKPKAPIPVPVEPEPLPEEPEYSEYSDEEFDCYDDLSEYRIYGNAPPKKFK